MSATFRIVPFQEKHLKTVLSIEQASQPSPWSEASFRNELDGPQSIFLVGLEAGEPIAYGGCWILADEAHITNLAVHPDHRRKGIARKLMNEIIKQAVARKAVCATLEVRAGNQPAIALYERFNFVTAGRRKKYYKNKEDAVIMWRHEL
jgi:ribosomal-protein-alanine N-acetyltransferase